MEKKFESTFLALSENNELLCQFCDKTFTFQKNLFCHIGIDHNKLEELLPNNKKDDVNSIKCRHCELETDLERLKSHYISTHYRDTFLKYCRELNLVTDDHSCKFCLVEYSEDEGLLEHLGQEHNLIFRLIANFQGKNVSAEFKDSPKLRSLSELVEMKTSRQEELNQSQEHDPLQTETVFVDAQAAGSPAKPVIKIVSPSKLKNVSQTKLREQTAKISSTSNSKASSKLKVKLPSNPTFNEYKEFCERSKDVKGAKSVLQSNFQKFEWEILELFLKEYCQTKSHIEKLEDVITLFAETYPSEKVRNSEAMTKFLQLKEYIKFCQNLNTTAEDCNPTMCVIFLSQLISKPGFQPNQPGLEFVLRGISNIHNKVDGKSLIANKKIIDFLEAIGSKIQTSDLEDEGTVTAGAAGVDSAANGDALVPLETPQTVEDRNDGRRRSTDIPSTNGDSRNSIDGNMDALLTSNSINSDHIKMKTAKVSVEKLKTVNQNVHSTPSFDAVDLEESSHSQDDVQHDTVVKPEKIEGNPPPVTLSEEPEVIDLEEEDVDYKYYCMECEGCGGSSCDHTSHPRYPLPFDVRPHFKSTGHVAMR